MPKAEKLRYVLLGTLFAITVSYVVFYSIHVVNNLRFATTRARNPFVHDQLGSILSVTPEAASSGLRRGDKIEQVRGKPFAGTQVLSELLTSAQAGDFLDVVVRHSDGARGKALLKLEPLSKTPPSLDAWLLSLLPGVLVPLFCLFLGFFVAGLRPQ